MGRKHYPIRLPRAALGIRAQDMRTLSRKAWWARRWIASLEALRLGARLGRGRQYAVDGQVTELLLDGPHVEAVITGSRSEPYRAELDFTSLDGPAVARMGESLKSEPMLLARVLAGDLPTKFEELFKAEGVSLFPAGGSPGNYDVRMKCTCPDWARPCKHLLAVLFLIGEEITRRPVTLLSLRGLPIEEILPSDTGNTQRRLELPAGTSMSAAVEDSAPLIRRLGPVPYWRGMSRCVESLVKIAGRVYPVARAAANGDSIDLRGP